MTDGAEKRFGEDRQEKAGSNSNPAPSKSASSNRAPSNRAPSKRALGWSRRRRPGRLAAALLIAGLAAGALHAWYWYWPRPRLAPPRSGDVPSALLHDSSFRYRLYLPFPHQNLAVLARGANRTSASGPPRSQVAPLIELPTFGGFRAPPGRGMTVAWSPRQKTGNGAGQSETIRIEARVFPVMALLSKLGGRLAGNPWLAGGRVVLGGREAEVEWRGTLWRCRSDPGSETFETAENLERLQRDPGPPSLSRPVLLAWASSQPLLWLAPGVYGLAPELPEASPVASSRPAGGARHEDPTATPGAFLEEALAVFAYEAGPQTLRALALLGPRAGATDRGVLRLPSSVAIAAEGEVWPLPAAALHRVLGLAPLRESAGSLRLVASDRRGLEAGLRLADGLVERQGSARDRSDEPERLLRVDLAILGALADDLVLGLEGSPLVPPDDLRGWRLLSAGLGRAPPTLLRVESRHGGLVLDLGGLGGRFSLRSLD